MNISEISIKNPVFSWMIMFSLILFGILGFKELGINENPDVDYPSVSISYSYDGATPEVVEKDVLEPVESVLVSMQGVKDMTSTANRGSGRIELEFTLDKDIDFALQEVQTLIGRAQRQLPDTVEPPTVTKSNAADDPILYLAITSETLNERELNILFKDGIVDRLTTIEGVSEVRAFGARDPMMRIDVDAKKLRSYQLTLTDIIDTLAREHVELPAGKFEDINKEESLRVLGEGKTVEDFREMIISKRGGRANYVPIKLSDVAYIHKGVENRTRISRVDGIPSLSMPIYKQRGANAVDVADRVKVRVDEISASLPEGTNLSVNFDRTQFVRLSIDELIQNLIISALLTSFVCWIFLNSISATINILLAIPTAIIGTFAFMHLFGFTLNTFSFLGLTLAIGIVVDDAIVMLENIVRYAKMGNDKVQASFKGSREITFAVLATTAVLIAIFAPISLMPGIEGRFFREFALTLCVAVALSSLEALTLAPMRCSQFLNVTSKGIFIHHWVDKMVEFTRDLYAKLLKSALKHKILVLGGSVLIFGLSLLSLNHINKEFAPEADRSFMFVIFIAPDGKSLDYTNEKVKQYEKIVQANENVQRVIVSVGGGRGVSTGNRGFGVVILKDRSERKKSQFEVAADLRKELKQIEGIHIIVRDRMGSAISGRRGSPVEFTITGPDLAVQRELFEKFRKEMSDSGLMVGIRSDDTGELPEVHITPDRLKAQERGVEINTIAQTLNIGVGGVTGGKYTEGGRRYDIFVQLQEKDRLPDTISSLLLQNNRGEFVTLTDVVDINPAFGPQSIYRENRTRGVRVDANLSNNVTQSEAFDFIKKIAPNILPEKYSINFSKDLNESLINIVLIMILGLVIAYMVLGSQFNSFADPLTVFLAVPFGLTGSFLALLATGQTLNIYSMIGILLTMGIVKKTSILIVEFSNQLRDEGKTLEEAVIEACTTRFRPIIMTTFTTLASAVPAAVMTGAGSETRMPMALVILGGVSLATIFTLFVVPSFYTLIARPRRKILREE
ncbi:probable membrane protein [Halobacteriovorax marinus SJ]|uniref:Probable membrane protein n=1 Tax=Halobacteriovorax marinus (strain ATCC BAA-682 / DSM 15412 / SJ) TaxID=862908 RepID=E1X427_HALMS|nr:efflux RND transporter permease subunit [Halobacteriovorax marinus]CBW25367.1 probable membrane protein [Halobacteriovorax marinus SJ]